MTLLFHLMSLMGGAAATAAAGLHSSRSAALERRRARAHPQNTLRSFYYPGWKIKSQFNSSIVWTLQDESSLWISVTGGRVLRVKTASVTHTVTISYFSRAHTLQMFPFSLRRRRAWGTAEEHPAPWRYSRKKGKEKKGSVNNVYLYTGQTLSIYLC